jgi:hypothetical protein
VQRITLAVLQNRFSVVFTSGALVRNISHSLVTKEILVLTALMAVKIAATQRGSPRTYMNSLCDWKFQ